MSKEQVVVYRTGGTQRFEWPGELAILELVLDEHRHTFARQYRRLAHGRIVLQPRCQTP